MDTRTSLAAAACQRAEVVSRQSADRQCGPQQGLKGRLSTRQAEIDELLARYLGVKGPWTEESPKRIYDPATI